MCRAAVVPLDHVLRVLRIDPHVVIIAVRNRRGAKRLAAVGALEPAFVANPDDIRVVRVDAERGVVERARDQRARTIDQRPARAAVFGSIQTRAGLGLNQCVDAIRKRVRNSNIASAEELRRQAAGELGPMVARVSGFVDATVVASAADDGPRLPLAVPHAMRRSRSDCRVESPDRPRRRYRKYTGHSSRSFRRR